MILHSIVPVEAMQQMMADWQAQGTQQPTRQTFFLSATCAVEGTVRDGQITVERIFSTPPISWAKSCIRQLPSPFPGCQGPIPSPKKLRASPARLHKKAGALWESLRQSLNRLFRQRFFLRCL